MIIKRLIIIIGLLSSLVIFTGVRNANAFAVLAAGGYAAKEAAFSAGVDIINANCRVKGKPSDTDLCENLNINYKDFTVEISYKPFDDPTGIVFDREYRTLRLDGSASMHATTFRFVRTGDLGCFYAYPLDLDFLQSALSHHKSKDRDDTSSRGTSETSSDSGDVTNEQSESNLAWDDSIPFNCIYLPVKSVNMSFPSWGNFISPVCLRYQTNDSHHKLPFLSVVMQCVQESIMAIFIEDNAVGTSFFKEAQNNLKGVLRALLALYIIIFGYNFIIKPGPLKNKDFHWFILKMILVWFFAVGPGMTQLLPVLLDVSREFSEMFLDAASGKSKGEDTYLSEGRAKDDLREARDVYEDSRERLRKYRRVIHSRDISGMPFADPDPYKNEDGSCMNDIGRDDSDVLAVDGERRSRCQEQNELDKLHIDVVKAEAAYEQKLTDTSILAYDYCNFSDETIYPYSGMDLRLWDTLDCRLAKYTGVGEIEEAESEPQLVLIAIASLWSTVWGILIFLFGIISILFIIMFILRMVNAYLMAVVGLILLVYFSPLFIPAALFEKTKSIFDAWLKQLISYTVQPIILFGFLAIFLAITDHVIFGDNSNFYQPDDQAVENDPSLLNKIILLPNGECVDENTIGCIYQKAVFQRTRDIGVGEGFMFTVIGSIEEKGGVLTLELLKLLFVFFIFHAVIGLVEQIATTITDAAAGGAASMSAIASSNPWQIAKGTASATVSSVKGGFQAVKGTALVGRAGLSKLAVGSAKVGGDRMRAKQDSEAFKSAVGKKVAEMKASKEDSGGANSKDIKTEDKK